MSNQITIDSLRLAAKVLKDVAKNSVQSFVIDASMMQVVNDIRSKSDNLFMVAELLETASQKDNEEVPF
ncbi:MAG: hypothetical protein FJX39_09690 [Alphaproteobacteria bacterium]|nr:hypothetical protein [Alphaproteobacteria bacterium]